MRRQDLLSKSNVAHVSCLAGSRRLRGEFLAKEMRTSHLVQPLKQLVVIFGFLLPAFLAPSAFSMEQVVIRKDGKQQSVTGQIQVEAKDGGMLLLGQDGRLWALQPTDIVRRKSDDRPFESLTAAKQEEKLLAELPSDFSVYKTAHYLICYNTNKAYAQWCGALYERLYRGFYNYWRKRGLKLKDPDGMLVAIVFNNQDSYGEYGRDELGDATNSIVGYYSLQSNRIATYDLTGRGELRTASRRPKNSAMVNDILSQPSAAPTVATIIHEATHQLAYNSGLQTRYADNPLWLSEGLAIYFETPDLSSSRGWRGMGAVNRVRLSQFRDDLSRGAQLPLAGLLTNDKLLRDPKTAIGGYAQSWGLCYFLAKKYPKQFAKYMEALSSKPPLGKDSTETRLELFIEHFGNDLSKFEKKFIAYISSLRLR